MKFLVVGDPHLTARAQDEYRWDLFRWLRVQIKHHKPDAVIILGDLTDKKDNHSSLLVNRLVRELRRLGIDIYILEGNHDYIDPQHPFFGFLSDIPNIHFIKEPTRIDAGGGMTALLLPHTRDTVVDWKKWRKEPTDVVAFMHQTVKYAKASNGQEMTEGVLDRHAMKRYFGQMLVVSGDIHVPQRVSKTIYVGTPYPVHFGDNFKCRVMLWDNGDYTFIHRHTISRWSLRVTSLDEVKAIGMTTGDHAKIIVALPRSAFHTAAEVKKSIQDYCAKAEVTIYGLKLVELSQEPNALRPAAERDREPLTATDAANTVLRYLERQGGKVSKTYEVYATDLVKRFEPPESRVTPGDVTFLDLIIQGFKLYRDEQTFEFPKGHGFYYLSGRNDERPRMGGNATAKSTLWDALCWVLYGKTIRGRKGPGIINWSGAHQCSVTVNFEKNGKIYGIARTQDPNSLTVEEPGIDPRTVTQQEIDDLIGLNYEQLLFTTLRGQFSDFFFDLGETQKLQVFSNVCNLQLWQNAGKQSSIDATKFGTEVLALKEDIQTLTGAQTEAKTQLAAMLKERKQFEKNRRHKIVAILKVIKKAKRRYRKATRKHKRFMRHLKLAEAAQAEANKHRDTLSKEHQLRSDSIGSLKRNVVAATTILKAKEAALEALTNGSCGTCGQSLPFKVIATQKKELQKGIVLALDAIALDRAQIKVLAKQRKTYGRLFIAAEEKARASQSAYEGLQRQFQPVLAKEVSAGSAFKAAVAERASLNSIASPFDKRIRQLKKESHEKVATLLAKKDELKKTYRRLNAAEYWSKGFKDLRLWLIEQAQAELEIEVNNAFIALGLEGWSARFAVERLTNKGSVSRGFQSFIKSPDSPEEVPWEDWSGGETQRLRIAGALGFGGLISRRRGVRTNVEVWDEPTTHMGPEGVQDMLQFLDDRAQEEKLQVWVVDHTALAYGFKAEVCVARTKKRGPVFEWRYQQDGE